MTGTHHTEIKIGAEAPLAEAAESLVLKWKAKWVETPSGMVTVPFHQFAPLLAHLRRRVLALEPVPIAHPGPSALLRRALDEGATLIAGGCEKATNYWQPMLFVNLPQDSCLFREAAVPGPRLLVVRSPAETLETPSPLAQP
jgi:hypothetical protein